MSESERKTETSDQCFEKLALFFIDVIHVRHIIDVILQLDVCMLIYILVFK